MFEAKYGMITNQEAIEIIKKNGTPIKVTIHRTHGDDMVDGYEYNGTNYTVELDRDGWPIAWVRK